MILDEIKAAKKYALNGGPFGSKLVTSDYVLEGVPVIIGSNLSKDTYFSFGDLVFVSEEKADELKPNNAHPGDIIFTQRGTLGQVGIIPKESKYDRFVISQSQMKLTIDEAKADTYYVYYYFKNHETIQRIENLAFSSGVPHINLQVLREFEIELPPLPTQRKIAAILSAYDDLIENNTRRIKILEEIAQALYREWFVHFRFPGHEKVRMVDSPLGRIPEGWEVTTIKSISNYINRGISPKYDDLTEYIVINQKCIRSNKLSLEQSRGHSSKVPVDKIIQFGDVLINSTGVGTLGRVAQVYQELHNCTVDSHVSIVRPGNRVTIDYFGLYLLNQQTSLENLGVGSTGQAELSRDAIGDLNLLLPPKDIQFLFASIVEPLRKNIVIMSEKNSNLMHSLNLLLPKLVSGEINVSKSDGNIKHTIGNSIEGRKTEGSDAPFKDIY